MVKLRTAYPGFEKGKEDWEVIEEIDRGGNNQGFITCDEHMTVQVPEMHALSKSRLLLLVVRGGGQNPIKASGLLLAHLEEVLHLCDGTPRIVYLQTRPLGKPDGPQQRINEIARQKHRTPPELIREAEVEMELRRVERLR